MVLPLYDRGVPVRGNRQGDVFGQVFWCYFGGDGLRYCRAWLQLYRTSREIVGERGLVMAKESRYFARIGRSGPNLQLNVMFYVEQGYRPLRHRGRIVIFQDKYRRYYPIRRT